MEVDLPSTAERPRQCFLHHRIGVLQPSRGVKLRARRISRGHRKLDSAKRRAFGSLFHASKLKATQLERPLTALLGLREGRASRLVVRRLTGGKRTLGELRD